MRMPEPRIEEQADQAYYNAYTEIAGGLNRKERRTAKGRLTEARALIAALQAQNEVLTREMEKNVRD